MRAVQFAGETTEVQCDLGDGGRLKAFVGSDADAAALGPGDSITVSFSPDDVAILDPEGEGPE